MSAKEVVSAGVICLFVSKITRKVMNVSFWVFSRIGSLVTSQKKSPKCRKSQSLIIGEILENHILLNSSPIVQTFHTRTGSWVRYHLTKFYLDRLKYADADNPESLQGKIFTKFKNAAFDGQRI